MLLLLNSYMPQTTYMLVSSWIRLSLLKPQQTFDIAGYNNSYL